MLRGRASGISKLRYLHCKELPISPRSSRSPQRPPLLYSVCLASKAACAKMSVPAKLHRTTSSSKRSRSPSRSKTASPIPETLKRVDIPEDASLPAFLCQSNAGKLMTCCTTRACSMRDNASNRPQRSRLNLRNSHGSSRCE